MNTTQAVSPNSSIAAGGLLTERIGILALAALYLLIFNRTLPDGDAMRVVGQIEQAKLLWNPNHLLFDPAGYAWYHLVRALGIDVTPLASFEFISAVGTLVSLLLFQQILLAIGISDRARRLVILGGLFASAGFLSVAIGQYYFMMQLPFLLAALLLLVRWERGGTTQPQQLLAAGALAACATAIMFNNLLLVMLLGAALATIHPSGMRWAPRNSLWFWSGAAAVGFPIFLIGYALHAGDGNLLSWLLSYQGDSASNLNQLYGTKATLGHVAEAAAQVVYNLLIGNQLETAGLGPVLSVIVFDKAFEFVPQWGRIVASALLALLVLGLMVVTLLSALRHSLASALTRLLLAWIAAYAIFNLLWSAPIEIFWFQILPAVWLLVAMRFGWALDWVPDHGGGKRFAATGSPLWVGALTGFVALLFGVNTLNAIVPVSIEDYAGKARAHQAIVKAGDLELLPGWDQQKWIYLEHSAAVDQIVLMNSAVFNQGTRMADLPQRIAGHLQSGKRVVVARVYDLDSDMMPWYSLAKTGWPRQKIQQLLSGSCNRVIGHVGDVTFRELYLCDDAR